MKNPPGSIRPSTFTCSETIGITYEPLTQRVWVACYGGQTLVFDDE